MVAAESMFFPWGKSRHGVFHHLAHHMADVAACFEVICTLPVIGARIERAAGFVLNETTLVRLAVLAFLHDSGKLHPGFQAKGWPDGLLSAPRHGHVAEGAAIFLGKAPPEIAGNLGLNELMEWGVDENLLFASLAHHGRPFVATDQAGKDWIVLKGYD